MSAFDASLAEAQLSRILARIETYSPPSLLFWATTRLYAQRKFETDQVTKFPPWYLLSIIEWALRYGPVDGGRQASEDDFIDIVNMIHELYGLDRMPNDYDTLLVFLKSVAFRQFWLQRPIGSDLLARSLLLFGELPPDSKIREHFLQRAGLELNDFIDLAFILVTQCLASKSPLELHRSYFRRCPMPLPDAQVDAFLKLISLSVPEAREHIKFTRVQQPREIQIFGETPLRRYPLLKVGDSYLTYGPQVLQGALRSFLYDYMKEDKSFNFVGEFGSIFERYFERALTGSKLRYFVEDDLRNELGKKAKVVDFLVPFQKTSILIDTKAVSLPSPARESSSSTETAKRLRDNVLKGMVQGFSVAESLIQRKHALGVDFSTHDWFLLLITYEDLHLGSGVNFVKTYASDFIEEYLKNAGIATPPIPLEHVLIVPIEDVEFLLAKVAAGKGNFASAVRTAAQKNASERHLLFRTTLTKDFETLVMPTYLEDAFQALRKRVLQRMGDKRFTERKRHQTTR